MTKILEGGVQRAGDRVRINVQLIDAATDAHLWAESYDRELSAANIFAIQSEVATAIAGALKASLTAGEQARVNAIPTQSLEAWQAYQLGKQRMARRTSAALTDAEKFFRKAITLDPAFALAWAGLADTLTLQIAIQRPTEGRRARRCRAGGQPRRWSWTRTWPRPGLPRDSSRVPALQFERAEQMLRRAIALNPNYATAHHWLSGTLSDLGRRDEALAVAERAVALDPLSAVINMHLGLARTDVGRFDDALIAYKQAIEIDPTMANPYSNIGDVHAYGFGRFDTAMAWYEKAASLDPGRCLDRPAASGAGVLGTR